MGSRNTGSQNSASNFYAFVGINRTLTAGEITDLETYLAAKSGVTLSGGGDGGDGDKGG